MLSATIASKRSARLAASLNAATRRLICTNCCLGQPQRHGFTVQKIRTLLKSLRDRFGVRLFDALGDGGKVTLLTDGREIYARTTSGEFYNLLRAPRQPLLAVIGEAELRALSARVKGRRRKAAPRRSIKKASKG